MRTVAVPEPISWDDGGRIENWRSAITVLPLCFPCTPWAQQRGSIMIDDIQDFFFTRKARAATHQRYGDPWSAAIYRTTHEDKPRNIRETDQFIVIENGYDTFYYDRDPDKRKRKYGMRDNGTQVYPYRLSNWFTRHATHA